jgi:uncharacterized membrane protein (UPF0127 family)
MARFLILPLVLSLTSTTVFAARDLDKLYEKASFKIGTHKFTSYIADDDDKRESGLMYIEKMPEEVGMIFVFEKARELGFWMKNTLIPLQIAFADHAGKILVLHEMTVADSMLSNDLPTYQSHGEAQVALEMNTGWFTRHKIKAGDKIELDSVAKSPLLNSVFIRKSTKQTRQ